VGDPAVLVPETSSALKAGVVTVRSVAVHVALEEGFYDPGEIMLGYELRNDLVHGTPTPGVPDKEASDFLRVHVDVPVSGAIGRSAPVGSAA
jgi:hypothetical protein